MDIQLGLLARDQYEALRSKPEHKEFIFFAGDADYIPLYEMLTKEPNCTLKIFCWRGSENPALKPYNVCYLDAYWHQICNIFPLQKAVKLEFPLRNLNDEYRDRRKLLALLGAQRDIDMSYFYTHIEKRAVTIVIWCHPKDWHLTVISHIQEVLKKAGVPNSSLEYKSQTWPSHVSPVAEAEAPAFLDMDS